MNSRQKELHQLFLDNEKAVLKKIEANYQDALFEIDDKIERLLARDDADLQNVIYQIEYQKSLKSQIQSILDTLHNNEFETVSEYLAKSYEDGFIGTMYDLQGQGIPLVIPIDQEQVVAALLHETKLSEGLYAALGKDINRLSKQIAGEISRGISNNATYNEIARNIANMSNIPKNNAMRIARTEAHRIQCKATADAQWKAKEKGADVVKQWDASLDGKTRSTHRELDGQVRELHEPFEVGGYKPMQPGDFGVPSEDCNCRCDLLSRARWALGNDFTKWDQETGGLVKIKAKDYDSFKMKYEKTSDRVRSNVQKMNAEKIEYMRNNLPKGYNDERNIGEQISEKDLEKFMKYASEQGIQIGIDGKTSGFETYCGDPEILYQMVDRAKAQMDSEWFKRTKGKKIILMYDNVLGYEGDNSKIDIGSFASTKGNTITLNKFMFDDSGYMKREYEKLANAGYFVKGTNYRNIVDHEIGHIIDNNIPGDRNKILKAFEEAAFEEGITLEEFIVKHISIYASDVNDVGFHELIPEINSLLQNNGNGNIIESIRKAGVRL